MGNLSGSDRDSGAIYEVRRRRLLLAVGGITLTGIVGSRWLSGPDHLPPHREVNAYQQPAARKPAAERSPVTHHAAVKHPDPRTYHPASYPLNRPLYYIDDASKAIALTIDDGPDPVSTPRRCSGCCTSTESRRCFWMVGLHVAAYPHLARVGHRGRATISPITPGPTPTSPACRFIECIRNSPGPVMPSIRRPASTLSCSALLTGLVGHRDPAVRTDADGADGLVG